MCASIVLLYFLEMAESLVILYCIIAERSAVERGAGLEIPAAGAVHIDEVARVARFVERTAPAPIVVGFSGGHSVTSVVVGIHE